MCIFSLLQVLCWGVRDMKRFRLLQVTSPLVELECGGNIVKTKHIQDTKKNPNFPDPVISMDVVRIYNPLSLSLLFSTFTSFGKYVKFYLFLIFLAPP